MQASDWSDPDHIISLGRTLDLGHCCMDIIYEHLSTLLQSSHNADLITIHRDLPFFSSFFACIDLNCLQLCSLANLHKERNLHHLFDLSVCPTNFIALLARILKQDFTIYSLRDIIAIPLLRISCQWKRITSTICASNGKKNMLVPCQFIQFCAFQSLLIIRMIVAFKIY